MNFILKENDAIPEGVILFTQEIPCPKCGGFAIQALASTGATIVTQCGVCEYHEETTARKDNRQ